MPFLLVGRDGIEPSTLWLKARCSTTELAALIGTDDRNFELGTSSFEGQTVRRLRSLSR